MYDGEIKYQESLIELCKNQVMRIKNCHECEERRTCPHVRNLNSLRKRERMYGNNQDDQLL